MSRSAECMGDAPHGPHQFNGGMHCPGWGYLSEDQLVVRHLARRDDDVAAWLKRKRNEVQALGDGWPVICGAAIDDLLDDYRAHADTGTPLDTEVPS